jgi:hypothetical protein
MDPHPLEEFTVIEQHNALAEFTTACWRDDVLKARFLANPKAILAERGIETPAHLNVKVVENTDDTVYITLPASPAEDTLSDDEIHSVSRGAVQIAATRPTIPTNSPKCQ